MLSDNTHIETIVGIDPGKTGAYSIVSRESADVFDLPVRTKPGKPTVKLEIDSQTLGQQLDHLNRETTLICLEQALGTFIRRTQDGSKQRSGGDASLASTWDSFGAIRGCVEALGFKLVRAHPRSWKAKLKLLKQDKKYSRFAAIALYPSLYDKLKLVKNHDRAESLLISHYAKYFLQK